MTDTFEFDQLQSRSHENSQKHGFWDDVPQDEAAYLAYLGNKIMLTVGELVEAHDEIRAGKGPGEIYYPTNPENHFEGRNGELHKPEGMLVELADAIIRIEDLAEYISRRNNAPTLAEIINRKHKYNGTRPPKHNKKF